tara:strand:- start:223 stop:615 length:393 start_codon:yes stop_codon:yes gene_type:complete
MRTDVLATELIIAMYFASGVDKIFNFQKTKNKFIEKSNVSPEFAQIVIFAAMIFLIVVPVYLKLSVYKKDAKGIKMYSNLLLGFTILATLLYHFPPNGKNYYPFMSNINALGGLLLLYVYADVYADKKSI